MSITISESGVTFGPFAEENVFELERILGEVGFGDYVRKVEFIVYQDRKNNRGSKISFVEARSSVPRATDSFFRETLRAELSTWSLRQENIVVINAERARRIGLIRDTKAPGGGGSAPWA